MRIVYHTLSTRIDKAIADSIKNMQHIDYIVLTNDEWNEMGSKHNIRRPEEGCYLPTFRGVQLK